MRQSSLKKTMKFAERAQHFFRLFPPYLLGDGLIKVSSEFYIREVMGIERSRWGVLAWDVAGMGICYMFLEAAVYFAVVLLVEYGLAAGVRSKMDRLRLALGGWTRRDLDSMLSVSRGDSEDVDVREERLRVDGAMAEGGVGRAREGDEAVERDTVLIQGLTKVRDDFPFLSEEPDHAVLGSYRSFASMVVFVLCSLVLDFDFGLSVPVSASFLVQEDLNRVSVYVVPSRQLFVGWWTRSGMSKCGNFLSIVKPDWSLFTALFSCHCLNITGYCLPPIEHRVRLWDRASDGRGRC